MVCLLLPVSLAAQELVTMQGNIAVTMGAGLQVVCQGGWKSGEGGTILLNGDLYLKQNLLGSSADWTDQSTAGVVDPLSTGNIHFASEADQQYTAAGYWPNVYKEAAGRLLLNSDLVINNELHLIEGKIVTGSYKVILLNRSASSLQIDGANSSWIDGTLKRYFDPSQSVYQFTAGTGSDQLLELINNPSDPLTGVDYIEAKFSAKTDPTEPILLSESGVDFVEVLPDGIWTLTPNQPATGGTYDLKFYLNGFSHLKDNNFIVVRRPDNSSSDADWEIPSSSSINATGGAGRMVADGYALRKNISGFSQFGIAVSSAALPVELTHFDGVYHHGLVQLQWSTASEAGAAYFKVERGLDGKLFNDIATLPAKGNSNVSSNYMYADSSAVALGKPLVYYRLRQTDKDGRFLLSKTVAVKIADEPQITVWGNPVDKQVQLTISLKRADKLEWQLTDAAGKLLQSGLRKMNAGLSSLQIDMAGLPAGMYYLHLNSSTISRSITLVKR